MTLKPQPNLTVLVGLPASGKSTARANATAGRDDKDSYQYSTDDKVDQWADELGVSYSDIWEGRIKQATAESDQEVQSAIQAGQNVIWDQTNMTRKKRAAILRQFDASYHKECICILPPMVEEQEAVLQHRLDSRLGKTIPDFVMRSMRNSFHLPDVSEGFEKIWFFDIYGNELDHKYATELFGSA